MSHKIDERKDNLRKLKEAIENTQNNMEFTNDMMDTTLLSIGHKQALKRQNKLRMESVEALRSKMEDLIIGKEKKNK